MASKKSAPAANTKATPAKEQPQLKVAAESLPRRTLQQALALAEALHKTYAGKSATWDDLATNLAVGPKSPNTKYLLWSA